jgi:mannose-6-phosphate isomerase-like protein (cupin superfamily)
MKIKNNILIKLFVIILLFATCAIAQVESKNVNSPVTESKYTIDNCINHFSMDKTVKTDAGYQYWYVGKEFADGKTLKLSVVAPHQATHAPHVHLEDEFYFILEGKAEVYLAGVWKEIEASTSFYCPSNVEHGIRNPGDTELKYLVIKQYPH